MHCRPQIFSPLLAMFASNCVLLFGTVSLHATTITFSSLSGANLSPFTIDTEGGFTVIPTLGTWLQGHVYGNPAPSILDASFLNPGRAEISVTYGGGLFTFNSLDFSSNNWVQKGRYSMPGVRAADGRRRECRRGGATPPPLSHSYGLMWSKDLVKKLVTARK